MKKFRPGLLIDERYEILSPIGVGGQGIVYQAYDHRFERKVAVKTMRFADRGGAPAGDLDVRLARFRREAQTLARLDHPNIVGVIAYGEIGDVVYLVTEYCDGVPVDAWGMREGPSVREWLRVARQILSALCYAHKRGMIHRDVKAENVLVRGTSEAPEVKVIDWGVAFAQRHRRITGDGAMVGTLGASIDPASFIDKGRDPDALSDLYAFGTLLYQLLCGVSPWGGATQSVYASADVDAVINAHFEREVAPPSHVNPEVPAALCEVVLSLMSLDPQARPASAAEALALIEGVEREVYGARAGAPSAAAAPPSGLATIPFEARTSSVRLVQCGELHVVLSLNTAAPNGDAEWQALTELILHLNTALDGDLAHCRSLSITDQGALNLAQRELMRKVMRGKQVPIVTISDNPLMRGAMAALRWTNPGVRCFATSQLRGGLEYLELLPHEAQLREALLDMQRELPVRVKSLELALAGFGREGAD